MIFDVAYGGASLDAAAERHAGGVGERDRALFRELGFGGLRWFWRCKKIVDGLVAKPLRQRDRIVEAVLITGIYQLDQMRLPAHAVLHATVQACETLDRARFKGLVNGVLRNFQRHRDELIRGLPGHARDAHPDWLWQAVHHQWPREAAAIVEANNSRPPMILRVNTDSVSAADYLETLREAGIDGRVLDYAPQALVLARPVEVDRLPGFRDGRVSIQDVSAQWLPRLVGPDPRGRALDACAAPGGKLTHLLESYPDLSIQAVEADPSRARLITDNLDRLRLSAQVSVADATEVDDWWDGRPFDLVVLDAPCTATGVVRRHPDIKVLRRASDTDRLAATQARLLDRLWNTVAAGGRLVYVTCSILATENQDQIGAFLERTPDARTDRVDLPVGQALEYGWQILPRRDGGDGFYYAVVRRDG